MNIETKDLILRKPEYEDWKSMHRNLWSHAESAKHMLWKPTESEEDARLKMERTVAYAKQHPGQYIVCEKRNGEVIGFAGIEQTGEGIFKDTGIALGPAFVGRGYGKQILLALIQYVKENCHAAEFICSCRRANVASAKLQLSCGLTYTYSEDKVDSRTGEQYILDYYSKELENT